MEEVVSSNLTRSTSQTILPKLSRVRNLAAIVEGELTASRRAEIQTAFRRASWFQRCFSLMRRSLCAQRYASQLP